MMDTDIDCNSCWELWGEFRDNPKEAIEALESGVLSKRFDGMSRRIIEALESTAENRDKMIQWIRQGCSV